MTDSQTPIDEPVSVDQVLDPENEVALDRQIPVFERYLHDLTEELNTEPDYHATARPAPRPAPPDAR